ncbi:glycoside hydrolase family protein [Luteibacter yeojuensis]|uniref:Lysozyme n=1 Tax=Luteibacter yeojuensis TaxID=345309 RepID=A0A7X5QS31_9GAMM|nr:lysozyme [Luteibacter yeojuensis]
MKARLVSAAVALIAGGLIAKYEPSATPTKPYWDPWGKVWTVCDGHTGDVDPKRTYTADECKAFRDADIAVANEAVNRCLPMPKLPQIEGALTDAAYNLGPQVVCGSTLQRKALANDWPAACAELDKWRMADGRVLPGLVRRRSDDRGVCEGRAVVDYYEQWLKEKGA